MTTGIRYNEKDYTGLRYGMLVALCFTGERQTSPSGKSKRIWLLRCDCGKEVRRTTQSLCNWQRLSEDKRKNTHCGCQKKHGSESVAYEVYRMTYADGDISFERFVELSQLDCFHCGNKVSVSGMIQKRYIKIMRDGKKVDSDIISAHFRYHGLDRIDNDKGHTLDNVVPCCAPCNFLRGSRKLSDFLSHVKRIDKNYSIKNITTNVNS